MGEYIMELRKLVGHRPLIQCAASVIVENDAGEVLLGRRADNHLWGYAGGAVELDETVEECAVRELFEETGIVADELTFFAVNSGPRAHYIYPNGDEVYNFEIVYRCRKWHGTPSPQPEEVEALGFFMPDAIPLSQFSPPIRPVWEKYLSARGVETKSNCS